MNTKKFLLATISGFIVMFFLGWLGHQVVIPGVLESNPMESIERSEPMILGIAVAYLIIALLMAYMYPKGIEGESVFGNGLRFGALVGLLITLPISLILYSTIDGATMGIVVMESLWHIVEQGIGGIVIAYLYGGNRSR